jgi:glutamate:GABA antiporter
MPPTVAKLTSSSPQAEHGLQRQMGLRDLVLAQVLCVVGSSWVGVAAVLGRAQALTWITAMVLFYFPMAAVVISLNRIMPLEGGLYVWAHRSFGDVGGFLTAWNLWVYGFTITVAILYAIPSEIAYLLGPRGAWLPENHAASLAIIIVVILVVSLAAVRGLEIGKWIHNFGGASIISVFVALILLPLVLIFRHSTVQHTPGVALALPPLNLYSAALLGQMLVGALSGLEYIAIFAGESRQPERNIARSVWISSPIICLMFILGTSSVVIFAQPGHPIDLIAPIPQTLRLALGHSGIGSLIAMTAIILLQVRLVGAASYLFSGVTRLPMAVGWDDLMPKWFTRLHPRWKTPVNSIFFTTALMLLFLVLNSTGVHAQETYQVISNASLAHYELAYLAMFAIPLVGSAAIRTNLPPHLKWISVLGFIAALISLLLSTYPFVDVVNPLAYAAKIGGTVLLSNLIALVFYKLRIRNRAPSA